MKALWLILKLNFMTWLPMLADALAFIKRNLFPILFALLIALVLLLSWRLDNAHQALTKAKASHAAELAAIDLNNARLLAQYQESARVKTQSMQRRVDDAQLQKTETLKKMAQLEAEFDDTKRRLNTSIGLLKQDAATSRARLSTLTQSAAADFGAACYAILGDLGEGGERLSQVGGDIAAKAGIHAADAVEGRDGWPVDSED